MSRKKRTRKEANPARPLRICFANASNKAAILILILIVILSAGALVVRGVLTSGKKTAVIYQNGEIIREIKLDEIVEPLEFTIEGADGQINDVRAEKGRIRIESASCPDKTCVHQGWIENGVVPIVCLPNKVTIEIRGDDAAGGEIDGLAGV